MLKGEITPLYSACGKANNSVAIRFLLEAGANPNYGKFYYGERSKYHYSPLSKVIKNGDIESVRTLLDYGAEINHQEFSYYDGYGHHDIPALFVALYSSETPNEMIELLLKRGADREAIFLYYDDFEYGDYMTSENVEFGDHVKNMIAEGRSDIPLIMCHREFEHSKSELEKILDLLK